MKRSLARRRRQQSATVFLKTHAATRSMGACRRSAVRGASRRAARPAGVAYPRGADDGCVRRLMQTVLGNVCGMVCDGAKANCASKVGMALHGAMQARCSPRTAPARMKKPRHGGRTLERTACNFFRLAREGK